MKTTTQSPNSRVSGRLSHPKFVVALLSTLLLPFIPTAGQAGSATWNLNPTSDDWNVAANWTPNTVPNSAQAVATFEVSNLTSVVITGAADKVDHITFTSGASPFTITIGPDFDSKLTFNGLGIVNNSGVTQNFVTIPNTTSETAGEIDFQNGATAGDGTVFTNNAGGLSNAKVLFFDNSSAGTATFINHSAGHAAFTEFNDDSTAASGTFTNGGGGAFQSGGNTLFLGNSSAGNGTFVCEGGFFDFGLSGYVSFFDSAAAGTGTFTLQRGTTGAANGGFVQFAGSSTADHSTFTAEGANTNDQQNASITFLDTSSAGDAIITLEGGLQPEIDGATLMFLVSSTAGNSTLIANNGPGHGSGATIGFLTDSTGVTARIELIGPVGSGILSIDAHNSPGVTVGSIEGAGQAVLGANNLTVGTNNLNTTFSGTITDGEGGNVGGSLTKVGTGALTLGGPSTYTGGTTVSAGILAISNTTGSGTGSGTVQVIGGTLAGNGTIAGAVTIGGDSLATSFLSPGSRQQATLTIQGSLTFTISATYNCSYRGKGRKVQFDQVVANGVSIEDAAGFNFPGTAQGNLRIGTVLTVISNTSSAPISGAFSNLPDGAIFAADGGNFQANYEGGDGNDLTLTVIP